MSKIAAATAALVLVSGYASAQKQPNPFSVYAGGAYFTSSDARNSVASNGFIVGVGYDQALQNIASQTTGQARFDVTHASGNGAQINVYALTFVGLQRFGYGPAKPGSFYGGFGAGVAYDSVNTPGVNTDGGVIGGGTTTKFNFAGSAILGMYLSRSMTLEAAYRYNGSVNGTSADTITLTLGFHF